MGRTAWTLQTQDASPELYSFEVNPKTDNGSFSIEKNIVYANTAGSGGDPTLVYERVDAPVKFSYSGIYLSNDQYSSMVLWVEKEVPVVLTDDLGQSSLVLLESLEITRSPKRHHAGRGEFTLTGFVLERLV